jgi:hypothetical protein
VPIHASENMKKRFGPLVKAHVANQKTLSSSSSATASATPESAYSSINLPERQSIAPPSNSTAEFPSPNRLGCVPVDEEECHNEEVTGNEYVEFDAADLGKALTFRSWYTIWSWLRLSPTMPVLKSRMEELLLYFALSKNLHRFPLVNSSDMGCLLLQLGFHPGLPVHRYAGRHSLVSEIEISK